MEIRLERISKRFTSEWIFRNISQGFNLGKSYAITGPNGSGKSTLLMIISGFMLPTEGTVEYRKEGKKIDPGKVYQWIDFAAPYMELVEELTLQEFLKFHFRFKMLSGGISVDEMIRDMFLENDSDKCIRNFSSGMKQRLKLGLGLHSGTPVLLLDEPTSNLDDTSRKWFLARFNQVKKKKLIFMASNQPGEYEICDHYLDISEFKRTLN